MNCYPPINKFYHSCWYIKERHSCADGECPRINQTQKMDLYLIELLRYQVLNGNKVGDGFVVKAWIETSMENLVSPSQRYLRHRPNILGLS